MMYHISPDTMEPKKCSAMSPSACRFYIEDGENLPHFKSKREAYKYAELTLEDYYKRGELGNLSKLDKKLRKSKQFKKIYNEEANKLLSILQAQQFLMMILFQAR